MNKIVTSHHVLINVPLEFEIYIVCTKFIEWGDLYKWLLTLIKMPNKVILVQSYNLVFWKKSRKFSVHHYNLQYIGQHIFNSYLNSIINFLADQWKEKNIFFSMLIIEDSRVIWYCQFLILLCFLAVFGAK